MEGLDFSGYAVLEVLLFGLGQAGIFFYAFSRLMARVSVLETLMKGLRKDFETMEERQWEKH